jgi:hypothetical protein
VAVALLFVELLVMMLLIILGPLRNSLGSVLPVLLIRSPLICLGH